jgi:hypothetical protein
VARSRFRSVRYDLAAAVEVARLADSAGGSIAADLLAPALGYSGTNNGAYLTRVANARLFGVVTGRGSRFELTERGRQILAGVEPHTSSARREAFLSVPVFRAVAEEAERRGGDLHGDLAQWLVDDFGEVAGKAQTVADRLVASAAQAGLLRRSDTGNNQLTTSFTNFTSVDKPHSIGLLPQLRFRRGTRSPRGKDVTVAENGMWLDEESDGKPKRISTWRRVGVVAAAAAVLVVVAVPVALVAAGSPSKPAALHHSGQHPKLGDGPAEHQVLSALSATTDTGNFNFSYSISSTPATSTAPATTSTTVCNQVEEPVPTGSSSSSGAMLVTPTTGAHSPIDQGEPPPATTGSKAGSDFSTSSSVASSSASVSPSNGAITGPTTTGTLPPGLKWQKVMVCNGQSIAPTDPLVKGSGVINTNPMGMVASANIGGGLDVTVRVDNTDVYEEGTGDTGLAPLASDASASGTSMPEFASITEGTLGNREGAVAMMGMASPTGYLDLIQPAIDAAAKTGTGTVDGVPVTVYKVSNDLSQLANAAGTSSAEAQTISAAFTLLKAQGFSANTAEVSIDGAGLIRQVTSLDTFNDGGTVTLQATFSNYGCAGTVLMPGQTGSGVPPSGCTSPDSANASATTTTGTS